MCLWILNRKSVDCRLNFKHLFNYFIRRAANRFVIIVLWHNDWVAKTLNRNWFDNWRRTGKSVQLLKERFEWLMTLFYKIIKHAKTLFWILSVAMAMFARSILTRRFTNIYLNSVEYTLVGACHFKAFRSKKQKPAKVVIEKTKKEQEKRISL